MPELPEIALSKKYIDATALHKKIRKIDFTDKSLLQNPAKDFVSALQDRKLTETRRLGKYLFIKTDKDDWLVLHFGMTGKLEYYKDEDPPKYSKMILSFEDSFHLAYICRRKLGKIYLAEGLGEFRDKHGLGKDALELDQEEFMQLLQDKKGSVKTALTDQHLLAGIGNVYADEILYQCGIHPKTTVPKLSEDEKKDIFRKMGRILNTAIRNDGERSELPTDYLVPHRKEGEDCPKCSGKIKKITVSGRSTYFCPDCQKEKK